MNDTTITIVMGVILLFVAFVLPQMHLRRDIPSLICIFREAKAVGVKNAKTTEELGLKPQSMTRSLFGGDPRWAALQALKNANIIQSTETGRVYLSEENPAASKWCGN